MSTERDTHFQNAARLFVDGLQTKGFVSRADFETYVAQFAYDLVYASCEAIDDKQSDYGARITLEAMIDNAPDLTAWPSR